MADELLKSLITPSRYRYRDAFEIAYNPKPNSPNQVLSSQERMELDTEHGEAFKTNDAADEEVTDFRLSSFGNTDGLQSIEAFERDHPYIPPGDRLIPLPTQTVSSENTIKFQHFCDQHGIVPDFRFRDSGVGSFIAEVRLPDVTVETTTPLLGKKAAKEAVSELAIARVSSMTDEQLSSLGVKRIAPSSEKSENFIGILHGTSTISSLAELRSLTCQQNTSKTTNSPNPFTKNTAPPLHLSVTAAPPLFPAQSQIPQHHPSPSAAQPSSSSRRRQPAPPPPKTPFSGFANKAKSPISPNSPPPNPSSTWIPPCHRPKKSTPSSPLSVSALRVFTARLPSLRRVKRSQEAVSGTWKQRLIGGM